MYNVDKAGNIPALTIGVINTNKQNAVRFDIRSWKKRFPDSMVYGIWITRPGETKAQSYPVMTEVIDGILYWYVSFADTEKHGRGCASIRAVEHDAENGIYAKSFDVPIIVADSAVGDGTDVPIIEVPWAMEVMQAKEAAIAAAAQAAESVEHYPQIGENGNWYVWDAESEAFVDTEYPARGAQGEQGAAGPQGPAGADGEPGQQGATGPQGPAGPQGQQGIQGNPGSDGHDGQDGVSPSVTVTEITGGHSVKITDAAHPDGQTFQVMDGEQGAKGDPGDDAPQIDDTQASPTNPYSGYHTSQLLSAKQDTISDLDTIRSGASAGATAYQKPSGGIPKADLASGVQDSLGLADTALQSYTETDPTVPAWAKNASKPEYTASEIGYGQTDVGAELGRLSSDKADLTQVVRIDTAQTLTEAQKSQAQNNAGIWTGTQAEYDAIAIKGANTIYMIVEATT